MMLNMSSGLGLISIPFVVLLISKSCFLMLLNHSKTWFFMRSLYSCISSASALPSCERHCRSGCPNAFMHSLWSSIQLISSRISATCRSPTDRMKRSTLGSRIESNTSRNTSMGPKCGGMQGTTSSTKSAMRCSTRLAASRNAISFVTLPSSSWFIWVAAASSNSPSTFSSSPPLSISSTIAYRSTCSGPRVLPVPLRRPLYSCHISTISNDITRLAGNSWAISNMRVMLENTLPCTSSISSGTIDRWLVTAARIFLILSSTSALPMPLASGEPMRAPGGPAVDMRLLRVTAISLIRAPLRASSLTASRNTSLSDEGVASILSLSSSTLSGTFAKNSTCVMTLLKLSRAWCTLRRLS
mmetsp:Transcript_25909/g.57351  ORF Transcript_25909/g.57351 Transcript_25909/m.57351 type:complete len:357 (+) Transcript_25909:2653-3723(+)